MYSIYHRNPRERARARGEPPPPRPRPPPPEEVTRREQIGTALFLVVLGLVFCALCALLLWHAGRTPLGE